MSPGLYGCVVCGYLIGAYGDSPWLEEFRAVYSSAEGTFISGVGRFADPNDRVWFAPTGSSARWDDPGYDFPPRDKLPVMRQEPENGRHGFVLHDSCWHLLQEFYDPDDVPIPRLLSICKSLPLPDHGICVGWGHHSYGGLAIFDTEYHYPWEANLTDQYYVSQTYAKANPYDVPEIPDLLVLSPKSSSRPTVAAPVEAGNDCFTIFPWEILEAISRNLLITDVLSLVRASKSFFPILTSQIFWASRFEPCSDRDFLFEKRNCSEPTDWKMLYQLTSRASSPPGLKNRRRIWELIQESSSLLRSHLDKNLESAFSDLDIGDLEWREAAGDIQPERLAEHPALFQAGCVRFHKQTAAIPYGLYGMGFSVTAKSVTGIRLISNNCTDICLGYVNKRVELLLEVAGVRGFILAIGSQGIEAVQVIDGNGLSSRWFGSPRDVPLTERLTGLGAIKGLDVGVDGYKLVSIAAGGPRPTTECDRSLRATALWYPTVPNPDLYLNDDSFTGESPLIAGGYQPLVWMQFGGRRGRYLQSIKSICVVGRESLSRIEFEYNTEDIPTGTGKLGRRYTTDDLHITRFQIDGPAGEFIETIAVSTERMNGTTVYPFYIGGKLTSFKITTNYGRSTHFKPKGSTVDETTLVPLSMAPGTTLTGLYASHHPEDGLLSLGAISEIVNDRE